MSLAVSIAASALITLSTAGAGSAPPQDPAAMSPAPAEPDTWEFAGSLFYSRPPGDVSDRLTGVLYADRGQLHLEARYNYEDLETASVFVGWKLPIEGEISGSVTPMLGGVFGDTDGVAPAVEAGLDWRRLAWYVEAEYVLDAHDSDDDFFYSWSTLTYGLTDSLRAGLVMERSKLVDTAREVQPGLALEYKFRHTGVSLYAYDLGTDDFYAVVSFQYAP